MHLVSLPRARTNACFAGVSPFLEPLRNSARAETDGSCCRPSFTATAAASDGGLWGRRHRRWGRRHRLVTATGGWGFSTKPSERTAPVLDGGVLDLGVFCGGQLHHRRVQRVLVERGRRAALQVGHVAALLRNDERALKLQGQRAGSFKSQERCILALCAALQVGCIAVLRDIEYAMSRADKYAFGSVQPSRYNA